MQYARIDDHGHPVEFIYFDPAGKYHESLVWAPVPERLEPYINPAYTWDGTEFQEPEDGYTLKTAIELKIADAFAGYNAAFAEIEKAYPQWEREGWPIQEEEAKALVAYGVEETPVLTMLVALRGLGETVRELADKVLANAAQYRGVYAWYTGQQQRIYREIRALTTLEAVQGYQVKYEAPQITPA